MRAVTKLAYGFIGTGEAGLYGIIGTFALFFLTTVVGINPAAAGTITAIGAVWETVCGAVVGYASDNTVTRYGKRKPYILISFVPLMVFTSLFFTNINSDSGLLPVYYGFMLVMFWTSYAVFYVPYLSWGAELTQDYDERTSLRGYAYFFSTMGMAIGLILPNLLVDWLMNRGISLSGSWMATGISCGVICGLTIFIGTIAIKDKYEQEYLLGNKTIGIVDNEENKKKQISLKNVKATVLDMLKNYIDILRLKTAVCIIGASVFYLIAFAMFSSVRMYYLTYNLNMEAKVITAVLMFLNFASIIFIPFIGKSCSLTDKRTTYIIGMTIGAVLMGGLGLLGVNTTWEIIIFSIGYAIGSLSYWQLTPSMIYDVCEVDELINNKRRGGLVISLQSLSESVANAIGLQLVGLILNFSGFDGSVTNQTESALHWISLSFSVIPALFMVASIICIVKYPVTKKMYLDVVEALKIKDEGKDIDMESFKRLR